jgi:hypothetical protein
MNQPTASILTDFATLDDPRDERGKDHRRIDIVAIAICAVIVEQEVGSILSCMDNRNRRGSARFSV